MGIEPMISSVKGKRDNRYTNGPIKFLNKIFISLKNVCKDRLCFSHFQIFLKYFLFFYYFWSILIKFKLKIMKIAIFSDIHGKILLPFRLVDIYQKATNQKIDLILQCGDIGAYPDVKNLDKATLKHANYDKNELGFSDDFVKINPKIQNFLNTLNLNMFCVRGNHEDHDFLDTLEQQSTESIFAIDAYKRVFVCKSGIIQKFICDNQTLVFAGIGRIGDRKNRQEKRFIQEYEKENIKKMLKTKEIIDILLTHDKNESSQRGFGMTEIDIVLQEVLVHYHFHGHTGEPFSQQLHENNITTQIKIKELEFDTNGILSEGCMVIFEKTAENAFHLEIAPKNITNQCTKYNWQFFLD